MRRMTGTKLMATSDRGRKVAKRGEKKVRRRAPAPHWLKLALRRLAFATALGAVIGVPAWLWKSGQLDHAVATSARTLLAGTARLGLAVEDVVLEGRVHADLGRIRKAVGLRRGTPILTFDPDAIRNRLTALGWVRNATVERLLPDTVRIRLTERRPIALWQHKRELKLIDSGGTVVTDRALGRFAKFLIVVGDDAPGHASSLIALLAQEPGLAKRISAAVRVGKRRWNLEFKDGIWVLLPEADPHLAWRRLAKLDANHQLLQRDIRIIDLRLPDRLIVRPGTKHKGGMVKKVKGERI